MRAPLPLRPVTVRSMVTRDGLRLVSDVYAPAADGPFPVLLMRLPYGRRIAGTVVHAHPAWFAAQGYIVVIQDVRGRGESEGTFRLFADDAADGVDTIAWAADLPGSTGAVGMYGFSYQGTNQLLALAERPPALRAAAPAMIGWDLARDWATRQGALRLADNLAWGVQMAAEQARLAGDEAAFARLRNAARALPVDGDIAARPDVMDLLARYGHYADWLDQGEDAAYWRAISPAARIEAIRASGVPLLFIGGWFDTHLRGTLAAHAALREHLATRLIVGPWAHVPWARRVGDLDFGAAAENDIDRIMVWWFDHWLKGLAPGNTGDQFFDMGSGEWLDPSAGVAPRTLHLSSSGRAAIDPRDGWLLAEPAAQPWEDWLVHDPWRPAPAVGGASGTPPGPVLRNAVDARPDVWTYTSAALDRPLTLAGSVLARLRVVADRPDFDLSCTLSRVSLDGRVHGIAEGYARLRQPGEAVIDMAATCVTLQPGEALRLSIAAAAFPAFPVNPGTGADPTRAPAGSHQVITLRIGQGSALSITCLRT